MNEKVAELIKKAEDLLEIAKKEYLKSQNPVESPRFKKLSDGWILDKALGIEWGPSSDKRMNLEYAKKYAEEKGGRLPGVKELRSLIDYDRYNPAIDTDFFKDTKTDDWYWTATPVAGYSGSAWCVKFGYGGVDGYSKVSNSYVRPVRSSQSLIL